MHCFSFPVVIVVVVVVVVVDVVGCWLLVVGWLLLLLQLLFLQSLTEYVSCVPPDACPPAARDQLLALAGPGMLSLTPFLAAMSVSSNDSRFGNRTSGSDDAEMGLGLLADTSWLGQISMRMDSRYRQ